MTVVDYQGFHPSKEWTLPRIGFDDTEKAKHYICSRTPFITTNTSTLSNITLESINKRNKDNVDLVEVEELCDNKFGDGRPRLTMKYDEFINQLPSSNLYLTTQYKKIDSPSQSHASNNSLIEPPLLAIKDDIPISLPIFNNLILHQINAWIGHTNLKTSSGLHHDYHDNFYFLLQGIKQFRIFSPLDAPHLYLSGKIRNIHTNGSIEYFGVQSRSDTASLKDVIDWKIRNCTAAIDDLHGEDMEIANSEKITELENQLDEYLDELLQLRVSEHDDDDDNYDDIDEEIDSGTGKNDFDDDIDNDDVDAEDYEDDIDAKDACSIYSNSSHVNPLNKNGFQSSIFKDNEEEVSPSSFSKIPSSVLSAIASSNKGYPDLKNATMIEFEIRSGDVLYLPAGWCHEVTSSGGTHLAINYWFYPPATRYSSSLGDEDECTYEDGYWVDVLKNRMALS